MNLGYIKKAIVAGALAAVTALLSFNIPGWIDGTEPFDWRSVAAAVVAAYITGLHTYIVTNATPDAPAADQIQAP